METTTPSYRNIIRHLAEGVHPITGEILSEDTVLNDPTVIRALFALLSEIEAAPKPKATKRSMPENFGKPWDESGRTRVREAFLSGQSEADLAKELKRTRGAITAELTRQGLISPSYNGMRSPDQTVYDDATSSPIAMAN